MTKPRKNSSIEPELEVLIQSQMRPDEMVRRWYRVAGDPDTVHVHLMDSELFERLQQSKMPRVRNSGGGRSLHFERWQGQWCFVGESGWVT